jgi:hypothetical protein
MVWTPDSIMYLNQRMQRAANDSKRQLHASGGGELGESRESRRPGWPGGGYPHAATRRRRAVALSLLVVASWCLIVVALLAVTRAAVEAVRASGPARPEDAVTLLTGVAGLVTAAWLGLATVVTVLAALRPASRSGVLAGRLAVRVAPAGLRRAVFVAVGISLVGAAPAMAQSLPATGLSASVVAAGRTVPGRPGGTVQQFGSPGTADRTAGAGIDPGWGAAGRSGAGDAAGSSAVPAGPSGLDPGWTAAPTPSGPAGTAWPAAPASSSAESASSSAERASSSAERPSAGGDPAPGTEAGHRPASGSRAGRPGSAQVTLPGPQVRPVRTDDVVVVRRGDCLWNLVARQLGPGASDAEIAAQWPRWYAANRATIGPDPDLLHPGQRLRPPGDDAATGDEKTSGGQP